LGLYFRALNHSIRLIMTDTKPFSDILKEWTEVFMHRSFRDFKRFLDDEGLSPTQANTLMRLYHCGASGVSDIGDFTGVTNAAASQMIERLVQMELIKRVESTSDRRFKQITLSNKGEQLVKRGIEARRRWLEDLTDTLEAEEQAMIANGLMMLTSAALKMDNTIPSSKKTNC
jgi:DNA-binding MarR family transcriptional regulator